MHNLDSRLSNLERRTNGGRLIIHLVWDESEITDADELVIRLKWPEEDTLPNGKQESIPKRTNVDDEENVEQLL